LKIVCQGVLSCPCRCAPPRQVVPELVFEPELFAAAREKLHYPPPDLPVIHWESTTGV